jgi:ABC-type nitrate/sulfonate/bicarbonate transport system substrate-binding protein
MELSGHDIVRQAGLDPDRDVIWVAVPGPGANRVTALVTGAVEAAILASPDNYRAEQQGFRRLKFVGENKLIVGGVAAASHLIQQRKDLVDRFVRATIRGLRLLVANREKGIRAFQEFGKVSPEIAAVTYDALAPTFTENGLTDEVTMRATIAKQAEVSGVKSLPAVEQVYDLESVHRALAGLR